MLIILTLIAGSLMGISLSKLLYRSWIAPIAVYSLIWGIAPALYLLKIFPWPDLSNRTYWTIFLSWFSFFVGSMTVAIVLRKKKEEPVKAINKGLLRSFILFFSLIGFAGSFLALFKFVKFFGLGIILNQGWLVRHYLTLTKEHPGFFLEGVFLFSFTAAGCALAGIYWGYFSFRPFLLLPLIAGSIYEFTRLGRWELFLLLLLYLSGWVAARLGGKELHPSLSHVLVIILVSGFIIVISLLVGKGGEYLTSLSSIHLPPLILIPLYRLNIAIYALDRSLAQESLIGLGKNTFYPIAKVLFLAGGVSLPSYAKFEIAMNPFFQWGERFVPVSWLGYIYHDFGWPGILMIPYLTGLISSWAFLRRSLKSTVILTFLYVLISQSCRTWYLRYPFFIGAFLIALAAGIVIQQRWRRVG